MFHRGGRYSESPPLLVPEGDASPCPTRKNTPDLLELRMQNFMTSMKSLAVLILTCTLPAAQVDSKKLLIQVVAQAEGPGLAVTSNDEKNPSAFP